MKRVIDFEWDKVWTTDDFDQMGWLDATLHGIAFDPDTFRFALDIDYIFEWIHPEPEETYYSFFVSPSTLIFENVHKFEMQSFEAFRTLQIKSIERTEPSKPPNIEYVEEDVEWYWVIDYEFGSIEFRSVGYKQYIRKEPVLQGSQTIPLEKRNGVNIEFP